MNSYGINPREYEYVAYLVHHIYNVQRSWSEFLEAPFRELFPEDYYDAESCIRSHDESKYSEEEWDAYCNYFYPSEGFEKDEVAFDYAWLHHQHCNPHHWQYWVLIRDEGEIVAMDMPPSEVANMLCDWHSFSAKDPTTTAYEWYNQNKENMVLSENTKNIIDKLIVYLNEPLQ